MKARRSVVPLFPFKTGFFSFVKLHSNFQLFRPTQELNDVEMRAAEEEASCHLRIWCSCKCVYRCFTCCFMVKHHFFMSLFPKPFIGMVYGVISQVSVCVSNSEGDACIKTGNSFDRFHWMDALVVLLCSFFFGDIWFQKHLNSCWQAEGPRWCPDTVQRGG